MANNKYKKVSCNLYVSKLYCIFFCTGSKDQFSDPPPFQIIKNMHFYSFKVYPGVRRVN